MDGVKPPVIIIDIVRCTVVVVYMPAAANTVHLSGAGTPDDEGSAARSAALNPVPPAARTS
jgi:hypothetical protein